MVQCHMYCAEQIVVPSIFPQMLKNYAKDAIRTQPYDLLRWSASYFRCLSLEITPPVKKRIEKEGCFGELTKGLARVLLDQIGKGYYVQRDVLQKKWLGLCLPEEDLFKILSLCRMYDWNYIHWLKVFAVIVGTLSKNLIETVDLICDFLTDEVEGGSSPIPMWMLQICYTFIAEMDCSVGHKFENGRKLLDNGELEEKQVPPEKPKILSSVAFRDAIIDEWKKHLDDFSIKVESSSCSLVCESTSKLDAPSTVAVSEASKISSSFKFVGDFNDPYEVLKKSNDFNSILVLLDEINTECHYSYEGPGKITERNFEHARRRELQILEKRDQMFEAFSEKSKKILQEEKVELIREIGPPWSWLHHFASQHCRDKSYNFLELESLSQISDETPVVSSDESFDFEHDKYLVTPKTRAATIAKKEDSEEYKKLKIVESVIRDILAKLAEAEEKGAVVCSDTSSVLSFMSDVEKVKGLGNFGDSTKRIIEFGPLKHYLEAAEEQGIEFTDMEELFDFFVEECKKDEICGEELSYQVFGEQVVVPEQAGPEKPESEVSAEIEEGPKRPLSTPQRDSGVDPAAGEKPDDSIDNIFIESGIENVDKKLLNKKISDHMILGLAPEPACNLDEAIEPCKTPLLIEPEIPVSERSETSSSTSDSTTLFSDVSSKVSNPSDPCRKHKKKGELPAIIENPVQFTCEIPPMPGIGGTISAHVIEEFLSYCKFRSRQQNGMIYPRNFRERVCPHMIPKH